MSDTEQEVIERAKEWFIAKRAAEESAGQPVNWESYNRARLDEAIQFMTEDDEFLESLVS